MTKSKRQRSWREQRAKRLLYPGFVLLIVLLCACNGGYEPVVGGEDTITYEQDGDVLTVTVHIPSRITDEIYHDVRKEDYIVTWVANPVSAPLGVT